MRCRWPALFVAAMSLIGCGGPGETFITGVVKYQGKPLICGTVTFVFDDDISSTGRIAIDGSGSYRVDTEGRGRARIAVYSPKPSIANDAARGTPSGVPEADPAKWFFIPEKYAEANTSGKEINVTSGKNQHDILLD